MSEFGGEGEVDEPEAVRRVRRSVVPVSGRGRIDRISVGTAFFVHEGGYLITANHVASAIAGDMCAEIRGERVPLAVAAMDAVHDLVVLRIADVATTISRLGPLPPVVQVQHEPPPPEVMMYNFGYIGVRYRIPYACAGFREPEGDEILVSGRAPNVAEVDFTEAYLLGMEARAGMSGGPVCLADSASVIGIQVACLQSSTDAPGGKVSVVVPIRFGVELLRGCLSEPVVD